MLNTIVGLMNSGKTLYMTYKLWIAYLKGKTIITNYDLNFPHYKINQDWLLNLSQTDDIVIENVAFGFDELWIWLMDSRKSAGKENRIATYFFLQSSKSDSEIYITAQDNGQNDKRLRQNVHKITQCSRALLIDNKVYNMDEEDRFLEKKYGKWINDLLLIKAEVYKRRLFFGIIEPYLAYTEYIPAKQIFNLFDTTQRIMVKSK